MQNTFGQPLKLSFTAVAGREPTPIDSIVAVRVYISQPSDAQVNDSTNAGGDFLVGSTDSADFEAVGFFEWQISLAKITAPKIQVGGWKRYYYAINYKYTSTGDTVGQWESFVIYYPDAIQTRFKVYPKDMYAYESKLRDVSRGGDVFCTEKLDLAEELMVAHLNAKHLDRNLIHEEDLRLALITWAMSLACNDLSSEAGDSWEVKALNYETQYKELLANLKVHYMFAGDNVIDPELDEVAPRNSVVIR